MRKDATMISDLTIAAMAAATAFGTPANAPPVDPVISVRDIYARANEALLKGDSATWSALEPLGKDFVLFSPFGGTPSRYADYTPERIERMGRFFRNGKFAQEVVQSFATDDMIVLATIERCNVEVGGLPAQDWALRVTSVFQREGPRWKLVHRHADPLANEISIADSARLARGEQVSAAK
jgi:ketosteroid isomerase-like protein